MNVESRDAERLATIEQILRDVRDDIVERKDEEARTRERLHKLEGLVAMLVDTQRASRTSVADRQRRLEIRMQVLTGVVAVAALLEPILYALAHH